MANVNKVILIGRLTRDPETKDFANGGKVCNLGFAVNNRRKNAQTGEYEDEPVFLDCKAFNRPNGRQLADTLAQHCKKGEQLYIEGRLTLEQWEATDGSKRSALRVIIEEFEFLGNKADQPKPPPPPQAKGPRVTTTQTDIRPPARIDSGADIPF